MSRVGNCAHPIRLHGHSETVDRATGEIVSSYSSSHEPLGVTHIRCGNRRATECPSCSRLYAADMIHLIRAGVSGGKYQLRGVVHFHALVRLDGPRTSDGFAAAPAYIDADTLAGLVRETAKSVRLTVPGVYADDPSRVLAFGRQIDARPVRTSRRTDDPARGLTPEKVAGHLAKYATKSADDTGAGDNPHHRRIRATTRNLAECAHALAHGKDADEKPYELLGKWVHMLGFRGHFASQSRHYSVTLSALRRARRRAQALIAASQANGRPLEAAALEADLLADDDTETTLVVGHWQYVSSGWTNDGQRVLAIAAAARAREYDQ